MTVRSLITAGAAAAVLIVGAPNSNAQPAGPTTEAPQVRVTRFVVTGSTVFTPEELAAVLPTPSAGRSMALPEIGAVAERVTALYRQHGYLLARAYAPEQDVVDGVVTIAVLEGRVESVEIEGARHYSADFFRSYIERGSTPWVFHADRFERRLLLLNDLPGLSVKSTLAPGGEIGTTRVILDVERDRFLTGTLEVNNYGTESTGRERFSGSLNLNSPLGIGDVLSFRAIVSTADLWLIRGGYVLPVNREGTRIGASYVRLQADVGAKFADLGIVGTGEMASVFVSHPFVRSRAFSLYGQIGFDYKDFRTTVLQETASRDHLRVLSAGLSAIGADPWRGLDQVSLTLSQGLGDFLDGLADDNDPRASRAGAGGEFTKVSAEVSRLQPLTGSTSLYLRGAAQLSSTRIVAPEQFIVGGQGSVRGYPLGELAGDSGFSATLELRWNGPGIAERPAFGGKTWGDVLQLFAFVDHGGVWIRAPSVGQRRVEDITGAGAGVRFIVPDRLQLTVELAMAADGRTPSDRRNPTLYFQLVTLF
jgi:hemolysin activation/secretion protein